MDEEQYRSDEEIEGVEAPKKRGRGRPRGVNANKKLNDDPESKYYKSTYDYNKQYSADMTDDIRLRVPKGWRDVIKDYVALGCGGKYRSVSDMICHLIADEISNSGYQKLVYPDPSQSERLEELRDARRRQKAVNDVGAVASDESSDIMKDT